MRIKQETVYTFNELSDAAKECARQWYREGGFDYEWYDATFDDAKQCLALAGFTVDKIYFSGFSSQGDGACFEGSWAAGNTKPVKAMKQHAPKDKALHEIAAAMREVAKANPSAFMSVKQHGHYCHEHCTSFWIESDDCAIELKGDAEGAIIEASKDAMRWIYSQLEKEHDWLNSDEQVDAAICANECEFYKNGKSA